MLNNRLNIIFLLSISSVTFGSELKGPNFVFFIADDISWDDLGCYGNRVCKTPNIDQLSSQGIRFTNFFLTASSCSPSRNSIITGRYPHNTGAAELHSEPPSYMVSFPEILKNQGYYTAQAGKFHMGEYARRGFDLTNENPELNGDGGEDLWVKVLESRPSDKPFMFWFASYDAHRPWGPNAFSGTNKPQNIVPPFYLADASETKMDLAKYYDEITRFDFYIGTIVKELREQNILENTVIIIMADNGRPFPHSKTRVNDRGMKTPFIICWPKGKGTEERICNSLVSSIDIAPTLLDLASIKIPESIQGVSFKSLLNSPQNPFRNCVFAEHNWHDYEAHERMVRTKDFLYILNSRPQFANSGPLDAVGSPSFQDLVELKNKKEITSIQADVFLKPRPVEELYNNISDPDQLNNLASNPKYQPYLKELKNVLLEWMDATGDNIPQNLTKDWYVKAAEIIKTKEYGHRGEMPGEKRHATTNNNKGKF